MVDITFEEIMQAVKTLTPEQKLRLKQALETSDAEPTRASLIAELEARRAAGAFEHVESLRNRYANPALDDVTDSELLTTIHDAATEWEQELDEFFSDNT